MIYERQLLPTKPSNEKSIILISLMLLLYCLENSSLSKILGNFNFNYIIKPILWVGLICLVWSFRRIRPKGKLRLRNFTYIWAGSFGIMYIMISLLGGLVDGLGKSPYDHSLFGIFTNIIFVGSALVGREYIRSYLVNSHTRKENYLIFILVAVFFTLTSILVTNFTNIKDNLGLVKFFAQYIGPRFAENIFATYLVYIGGPVASIIYLTVTEGFHWLSPILPDLKWITTALIGTLSPVFFMMTFQTIYKDMSKEKRVNEEEENPLGWIFTSIISISIIWFSVGVFPVYPSVIVTGSMEPEIKVGDVILVEKISDIEEINALEIGDVIQFKREDILISHRIIDIEEDKEKGIRFETKGDNNTGADIERVEVENVKGKIIKTIPKVGYPTLIMKKKDDTPLDDIVY